MTFNPVGEPIPDLYNLQLGRHTGELRVIFLQKSLNVAQTLAD
jgi:hypothetical protein